VEMCHRTGRAIESEGTHSEFLVAVAFAFGIAVYGISSSKGILMVVSMYDSERQKAFESVKVQSREMFSRIPVCKVASRGA
jgi:aspartate/tyrosine/aromatic aminotransferase